jgi:hypothetical protein
VRQIEEKRRDRDPADHWSEQAEAQHAEQEEISSVLPARWKGTPGQRECDTVPQNQQSDAR